jgi:hypothetical protein
MIAGVLAVVATNFCILCVMSAGFFFSGTLACVCAWLMWPAFHVAEKTDSIFAFWVIVLLVGFIQFFIPFWIGLKIKYGKRAN